MIQVFLINILFIIQLMLHNLYIKGHWMPYPYNAYHDLCYTCSGALVWMRKSWWVHQHLSIWWSATPWVDALLLSYIYNKGPIHIWDNVYHGLCYTSCGALVGMRKLWWVHQHLSIWWSATSWVDVLPLSYILLQFNELKTTEQKRRWIKIGIWFKSQNI